MLTTEQNINVNRLIEELRSGEYKQADSALKVVMLNESTPRYCCLGVAAEAVLGREFVPEEHNATDRKYYQYYPSNNKRCTSQLAAEDMRKFGFDQKISIEEVNKLENLIGNRLIGLFDRQDALMSMNDRGISFENIATVLVAMGWDVK